MAINIKDLELKQKWSSTIFTRADVGAHARISVYLDKTAPVGTIMALNNGGSICRFNEKLCI